ncbi:FMRFamide receptor-like [Saccostrea echinata]|uniref:FMRFamide receptor-like n=1 Tax=Saccostrea echinata TaxID=191078 RepID=UPI002A81717B|nr:FMRFamide receptor-like [Saccostrea echinata]
MAYEGYSQENLTKLYITHTDVSATKTAMCETARFIETAVMGYLAIVIVVLGMIGNSLSIVVLTRKAMHTSTNCYLLALAIWDTVVIICTLLLMSIPSLSSEFRDHVMPYVVVLVYPLALTAQMSTLWLTVSFTVERYIAVCHPLRAARMCTVARARVVIVIVSVVSVLFNMSRWFEYRLKFHDPGQFSNNRSAISYEQTDLVNNDDYKQVYFFWLYLLVMFIVPLISLSVLNTFLILAVRQSQIQRKDMNVRQSRENNVTIMLVSIIIVFIICQIPALIYNLAWAIDMHTVKMACGWNVLSTFRNFMVTLNSCVNFILYCALGQRFRHTFIRSFCRCLILTENGNSFRYVNSAMMASSSMNTYSKYRLVRAKQGLLTFRMNDMSPPTGLHRRSTLQTSMQPSKDTTKVSLMDGGTGTKHSQGSSSDTTHGTSPSKDSLNNDMSDKEADTTNMVKPLDLL